MGAYKDFDAARAERDSTVGELRFRLMGREFTTRTVMPALPLLDLAAMTPESSNLDAMRALSDFLLAIVNQRDDMRATLSEVGFDTLFTVVAWIIEEITGRPLGSASSSPEPLSWSSSPPRVVSLSPVSEALST